MRRAVAEFAAAHLSGPQVCVGLSGGPDSLALTAAAVGAGLDVTALLLQCNKAVARAQLEKAAGMGAAASLVIAAA